jgi:hypothetical protein
LENYPGADERQTRKNKIARLAAKANPHPAWPRRRSQPRRTRKNYLNVGEDFLRLLIQSKVMSKAQAVTTAKPAAKRRMYRGIVRERNWMRDFRPFSQKRSRL